MNDLDDRLTDLLGRSAAAVEIDHDLEGVIAPGSVAVRLTDRPRRTRRRLAVAGIAAAVIAVGATAVAFVASDDEPVGVADAAGPDDHFPVLSYLPEGLAGREEARTVDVGGGPSTAAARAVLGRMGDGAVDDLVSIQASPGDISAAEAFDGEPATIAGQEANVARSDGLTTVALGGDPLITVSGEGDVVGLIEALGPGGLVAVLDETGAPLLSLADPPSGYTLLVPPGPWRPTTMREVVAEGGGGADVEMVRATTGGDLPLATLSYAGRAESVTVGGAAGWLVEVGDATSLAWTAANGTTVAVDVTGGGRDVALRVAEGVRLVDEATWRDAYPEAGRTGEDSTDTTEAGDTDTTVAPDLTETTVPVGADPVGRPAPPVRGQFPDVRPYRDPAADGDWAVISFVPAGCAECRQAAADQTDLDGVALAELGDGDIAVVIVVLDDENDTGLDVVPQLQADDDGSWQVLASSDPAGVIEEWGLVGAPATVVVDPDGIVRAVVHGVLDAPATERLLADLGG